MRLFLSIAICKILYFIGRRMGKGSSLPGRVALALYPDILKRIKLPKIIIAVTGSNGKTSTTELIAQALRGNGISVEWNREGANQIEGIATLILRAASYSGAVRSDALILECDERYALQTFRYIKPTIVVITNLCRDQLTRNGHPEFIQDCLRAAISTIETVETAAAPSAADDRPHGENAAGNDSGSIGAKFVLNADDPYVMALAPNKIQDSENSAPYCYCFGISGNVSPAGAVPRDPLSPCPSGGTYDDGAFCPVCKERMTYDYRVAGHMGGYRCGACGHMRRKPEIEVTGYNSETGEVTLTGGITTRLAFPSLTGVYNTAAAIAAAAAAGAGAENAARVLDGYELTGGRTLHFSIGGSDGILLISKHENSLSYNQSLAWAVGRGRRCTVVIMVDSISRKYYTGETSWLWDIDFGLLADDCVKNIVLTGRYINELAVRFAMTAIDPDKIIYLAEPGGLRGYLEGSAAGNIYAITCFADKDKLLRGVIGSK